MIQLNKWWILITGILLPFFGLFLAIDIIDIIKGTNTNWLVYPDAIALLAIMISMIGKVWLS